MKSVLPDFRAELLPLLKKKKEAIFSLYHYHGYLSPVVHIDFLLFLMVPTTVKHTSSIGLGILVG